MATVTNLPGPESGGQAYAVRRPLLLLGLGGDTALAVDLAFRVTREAAAILTVGHLLDKRLPWSGVSGAGHAYRKAIVEQARLAVLSVHEIRDAVPPGMLVRTCLLHDRSGASAQLRRALARSDYDCAVMTSEGIAVRGIRQTLRASRIPALVAGDVGNRCPSRFRSRAPRRPDRESAS